MEEGIIRDNDVFYKRNYPRQCAFKNLQLITNLSNEPEIYCVELITKEGEKLNMAGKASLIAAIDIYRDIEILSPDEIDAAFGAMI